MAVRPLDLNRTVTRARAPVFAVDGSGRIRLWNRAAERFLGYAAHEVLGRPSCEVFPPHARGAGALCYRGCHVGLIALDGPAQNASTWTSTKKGRPIRVDVSAIIIAGPRDRSTTVVHRLRERSVPPPAVPATPRRRRLRGRSLLTGREIDVLRLMANGMNTRTIAAALHISEATVRNHVQSILGTLGVHSRLAAVAFAHRHDLL